MSRHADWLALVERDGLVLSEPVLDERFPDGPIPVSAAAHHWFRRRAERWRLARGEADGERLAAAARDWIDGLLENTLGLRPSRWRKGAEIPADCTVRLEQFDQWLRADRVLVDRAGKPALLVSVFDPGQGLDRRDRREARWKASPTTKLERLLRETGVPVGLVTNGDAFRLMYAPAGLTAGYLTWTTRLLVEEKATLDALHSLLHPDLLAPEDPATRTLADLCRISVDRQADVADQLGRQVRDGLERLLWAWDEADREARGDLLRDLSSDDLYETGLTVMMRLVFLLYAEERDLLPHGEVLYDQGYGLTWLWHRLQEERRERPGAMSESRDGWDRFLATCRLVHDGCEHPDLSLIPYGGRLFDARRFPMLEHPACRVSNEVFYEVLRLLLFAAQRKGGEPQRVGYWALDVEQIGYVYEGLLDHRCARAGDQPVVKLRGAGEAAVEITELERRDPEALVAWAAEETGRKAETIREALAAGASDPRDRECLARLPEAVAARVEPYAPLIQCGEVAPPGWLYLTTGTSRRASGAHYTPQSLTERIVRTTLEPLAYRNVDDKPGLLVEPRQVKSPRELLDLKVCDIAMGSGAFLVQAVRYLGDRLVEAWDRAIIEAHEANPSARLAMPYAESFDEASGVERALDPEKRDEMVLWARRLVVERCVYGVDKNPLAVEMARLSLWLTTLAKERPFTFLDHALRCGDSLVGVDREQLLAWSIDRKGEGAPILRPLVARAVDEALGLRRELAGIPVLEASDTERKAALLARAETAMERVRLAGDLVIAPSFAEEKSRKQAELRDGLQARFVSETTPEAIAELRHEADRLLGGQRTFHWPLEFPEVFADGDRGGFDAIVGNPPFMGGRRIRGDLGDRFAEFLPVGFAATTLGADLVTFFFRRAFDNLRTGGTFGLIATNTIGQGDTRESGLDEIAKSGGAIYAAVPRMPWPGLAAVNVSVVHVARGGYVGPYRLAGVDVPAISTALDSGTVEGKPYRLAANSGLAFIGCDTKGLGFTMTPEDARAWIARDARNADVLHPYLNGEDLNTSPSQEASRWAAFFHEETEEDALRKWAELAERVRERVQPQRAASRTQAVRDWPWWKYWRPRDNLYRTIAGLERVLVVAAVSRTLAFAWVPNGWVYNHKCIVLATDRGGLLGLLQSGVHATWAWRFSSTLKTDLNYSPTDCFETFPFPSSLDGLDAIGEAYHEHRRQVMLARGEGLTKTYNRFHDPKCTDADIARLRELHVEMDIAVRDAYGWTDLDLGHGWIETVETEEKKDRKTGKVLTVHKSDWRYAISEAARREVLRRLLALNHRRYAEEVAAGLHDGKKGRPAAGDDEDPAGDGTATDDPSGATPTPSTARSCGRRAAKSGAAGPQVGLFDTPQIDLFGSTRPAGSAPGAVQAAERGAFEAAEQGAVQPAEVGAIRPAERGAAGIAGRGVPAPAQVAAEATPEWTVSPATSSKVATSGRGEAAAIAPVAAGAPDGGKLSADALAVLTALAALGGWRSKSEILEQSGLPAPRWSRVIGELVDAGRVERQGEKRWVRYRVVVGGTTTAGQLS